MTTAQGSRLTEAHRLAQARLGAQTVQALFAAWALIDPADLDATTERWLSTATAIVRAQRVTSARLAANYYTAFRALEIPGAQPVPVNLAELVNAERLLTSLLVTGPVHVRAATGRGAPLGVASDLGMSGSAAAGARHALDGGRETTLATANADRRARGWTRVTSGSPCEFCDELAGVEFATEDAASFESHDGCHCAAEALIS